MQLTGCAPPRADGLLAVNGVLEVVEQPESAEARGRAHRAMLGEPGRRRLTALVEARARGRRPARPCSREQLDEIARLSRRSRPRPARSPSAIEAASRSRSRKLLEARTGSIPTRLHQEAVLLATRADVEEELNG